MKLIHSSSEKILAAHTICLKYKVSIIAFLAQILIHDERESKFTQPYTIPVFLASMAVTEGGRSHLSSPLLSNACHATSSISLHLSRIETIPGDFGAQHVIQPKTLLKTS